MKRLVKNLFAGFVCSVLLVGCGGQEVQDTRTPVEKMDDLFDVIIDSYNTEIDNYDAEYKYDAYEGIYYLILHSKKFTYNGLSQMIANEGRQSLDDVVDKMETDINEDIIPLIRETEYLGQVKFIIKSSDGKEVFTYYLGIEEDKISKVEVFVSEPQYQPQPEPKQNIVPQDDDSQVGIGTVFEIESYNYEDRYPAYYSETGAGESVLNVHIENDSLQVADLNNYYMIVAYHAVGIDYIVFTFGDGSNCVIDHATMEYYANQDINYYRN